MDQIKTISNLLKVLSNDNRLTVICKLLEQPLTVGELQTSLAHISQAALSQHLAVLKANQLVSSEKNGMHITYAIADERLKKVIETLKATYCEA